jgi:hypothetical protein
MDLGETLRALPKPKRLRAAKHISEPSGVPPQSSLKMNFAEIVTKAKASSVDDEKAMSIAELFLEVKALGKNSFDKAKYGETRSILERQIITAVTD